MHPLKSECKNEFSRFALDGNIVEEKILQRKSVVGSSNAGQLAAGLICTSEAGCQTKTNPSLETAHQQHSTRFSTTTVTVICHVIKVITPLLTVLHKKVSQIYKRQ